MSKRILVFTVIVILLFLVSYFTNQYLVETNNSVLQFPLLNVYLFLAIATLVIYVLIELVIKHLPNESGYLYLALTMVKMGIFVLLFQESIFSEQPLSKSDKFSLVIPFFIFLLAEAIAVAKLLNAKDYTQKIDK